MSTADTRDFVRMTETERRELLLHLVSQAIEAHDRWADDNDQPGLADGMDQSAVDLVEAVNELVDSFQEMQIPGDCRDIAEVVSVFGVEWRRWLSCGSGDVPLGECLWQAWDAVCDAYRLRFTEQQQPPRIESVATLHAQEVSIPQIAEIYGWLDERGKPETWRVKEEIAEPGKHSKDCVDPMTKLWREKAEQEQARIERVKQLRERKIAKMLGRINATPPESLKQLVAQEVPVKQIAEMLKVSEGEVLRQCEQQGLPRPGETPNIHATRSAVDPDLPEPMARQEAAQNAERDRLHAAERSAVPATDASLSLEQQIIQLHLQGVEPTEIAEKLTAAEDKVTQQKAAAVIRRFKHDPDAIGMPR